MKPIKRENKKGISVMIGYVLLITGAIVMSILVYQWLRSYVPSESPECPADVSVFIKEHVCSTNQLDITLKNNGKFNIAGYFIHVSDQTDQKIATTDISQYIESGGIFAENAVIFLAGGNNAMKPNDEKLGVFGLSETGMDNIYLIEIIPARFQKIENRLTFISCGNAKVREEVSCNLKCSDSDGGINTLVAGTCTDDSGSYADYCEGNAQKEYYCSPDNLCVIDNTGCPSQGGYECQNGACAIPS